MKNENEDIWHSFDILFNLNITKYISVNRNDIENEKIKKVHFKRTVLCVECKGMRTKDNLNIKKCSKCSGIGRINMKSTSTLLGNMETSDRCVECEGVGKIILQKCVVCNGKGIANIKEEVEIKINRDINLENKIEGKGNTIIHGENISIGDLIIHVKRKKILWFKL